MTLTLGDHAPDFSLSGDAERPERLSDLRGGWTVVFFYPRANSSHCAMEARRFQKLLPDFEALGARVVGVSVDPPEKQAYFRDACVLSFPLVSDPSHEISRDYGVLGTLDIDGEEATVARRETFLLDPEGRVVERWSVENPPNRHAAEVLEALRARLA